MSTFTIDSVAISLHLSLADTHFTDEDLDFIIDRACRLGRGEHVESRSHERPK